jgi:hypothetical protein
MILLNFAHPLTEEPLARIEALTGKQISRRVETPAQFDPQQPFTEQTAALLAQTGLTPAEWQTAPLLVNPPIANDG